MTKEMFGEDYTADRELWKNVASAMVSFSQSLDGSQPAHEHKRRTIAALVALTPWTEPEWWESDVDEAERKLRLLDAVEVQS